jgi:hypothetical protein
LRKQLQDASVQRTIDDLLIDISLQEIDGPGAIPGAAGPCLVRSSDFLSLYGIMFFDTADLDFLEDLGFFDEVVKHEMGHVLGFGTLWSFGHDLLEGAGTADPRFTGPLAIAAYDRLGGTGTVPVRATRAARAPRQPLGRSHLLQRADDRLPQRVGRRQSAQ